MEGVAVAQATIVKPVVEFRPLYTPTDSSEKVQATVVYAIQQYEQDGDELDADEALLHHVGRALQAQGGMVVVRRGLGARDISKSASTLKNTFLVVRPAPGEEDLVVELNFAAHFQLANASPAYQQQLARAPAMFVGGRSHLLKTVSAMAAAAAEMYLETRTEPPPWRSRSALLSKWLPARAFDSPVLDLPSWNAALRNMAGASDTGDMFATSDSTNSSGSNSTASSYASLGSSVMSSGYQAELESHMSALGKRYSRGSVSASQVLFNAAAPLPRVVKPLVVYGFAV